MKTGGAIPVACDGPVHRPFGNIRLTKDVRCRRVRSFSRRPR
jgi:hypothetical protein